MIDVTVLLLEGGLPSTSLAPLEIFACAGTLFGMLTGAAPEASTSAFTHSYGRRTQEPELRACHAGAEPRARGRPRHGSDRRADGRDGPRGRAPNERAV